MPETLLSYNGRKFTASIEGEPVEGEILVRNSVVYLLQNRKHGDGPAKEFRRGYSGSWNVGNGSRDRLEGNAVLNLKLIDVFKQGDRVRVKSSVTSYRYGGYGCLASTSGVVTDVRSDDSLEILFNGGERYHMDSSEMEPDNSVSTGSSDHKECPFKKGDHVLFKPGAHPYRYGGDKRQGGIVEYVSYWNSDMPKPHWKLYVNLGDGSSYTMADYELTHVSYSLLETAKLTHGITYKAKIKGTSVEGRVTKQDDLFFLCQDKMEGSSCRDKLGYRFSWCITSGSSSDLRNHSVTDLELGCFVKDPTNIHRPEPKFKEGDYIVAKSSGPLSYGGSGDAVGVAVVKSSKWYEGSTSCWDYTIDCKNYKGFIVKEDDFKLAPVQANPCSEMTADFLPRYTDLPKKMDIGVDSVPGKILPDLSFKSIKKITL